MSLIELRRLFEEWRIRLQRVKHVLQPPAWTEREWHHFSKALYLLIKKYGSTWTDGGVDYADLRWDLKEGGQLICQVEERNEGREKSIVVAQSGGFAEGVDHYTWYYGLFNEQWRFIDPPYWVDGSWREALAMIILPQQMAAGFYLGAGSAQMQAMLLQESNESSKPNQPASVAS
jgi:hypothetical protein